MFQGSAKRPRVNVEGPPPMESDYGALYGSESEPALLREASEDEHDMLHIEERLNAPQADADDFAAYVEFDRAECDEDPEELLPQASATEEKSQSSWPFRPQSWSRGGGSGVQATCQGVPDPAGTGQESLLPSRVEVDGQCAVRLVGVFQSNGQDVLSPLSPLWDGDIQDLGGRGYPLQELEGCPLGDQEASQPRCPQVVRGCVGRLEDISADGRHPDGYGQGLRETGNGQLPLRPQCSRSDQLLRPSGCRTSWPS